MIPILYFPILKTIAGWLNESSVEIWLTILNVNVSLVIPFQIIWASENVKNYLLRKFS